MYCGEEVHHNEIQNYIIKGMHQVYIMISILKSTHNHDVRGLCARV